MKVKGSTAKNLIPEFLHKLWWIIAPLDYMSSLAKSKGDFFKSVISSKGVLYMISNPQALKQVINKNAEEFSAPGEWNDILRPLLGNYSVILLSGKEHQRQRQLLEPPFHGERVNAYSHLICDVTKEVMNRLPVGEPFIAHDILQDISLQIILQAVFGVREGKRYELLKQNLSALLEIFDSPVKASFQLLRSLQHDLGPWSPWGNFLRQREAIDKLIYAEISERRASDNSQRTDILSLLINARDETGNTMMDTELRDELLTLLIAGHETTATAITWVLYWTHYLDKIGEKLQIELNTLGENPSPADILKLPYLSAVCKEALRIYPVLITTFVRQVKEPVELMSHKLSVGDGLIASIYLLHQREDLYPEPERYKPERFLERQFSSSEFMPFGGGYRRCIGSALALSELKLVVATILMNYQLELTRRQVVKPQRRGLTLAPKGGVKMIMRGRRS